MANQEIEPKIEEIASLVRKLHKRNELSAIIQSGKQFLMAKKLLSRRFVKWLDQEFPHISYATIINWMNIARVVESHPEYLTEMEKLPLRKVYKACSRNIPEEIRKQLFKATITEEPKFIIDKQQKSLEELKDLDFIFIAKEDHSSLKIPSSKLYSCSKQDASVLLKCSIGLMPWTGPLLKPFKVASVYNWNNDFFVLGRKEENYSPLLAESLKLLFLNLVKPNYSVCVLSDSPSLYEADVLYKVCLEVGVKEFLVAKLD